MARHLASVIRNLSSALCALSIALHLVVGLCYVFRWDRATAVTTIPLFFWACAGLGLVALAWALVRRRSAWQFAVALLWIVSYLVLGDEPAAVARGLVADPPAADTRTPGTTLRVATLNCRGHDVPAALELEAFRPDIIFYQESPHYRFVHDLAQRLYGSDGSFIKTYDVSILARGRLRAQPAGNSSRYLQATLTLPDGQEVEIAGVHLTGAVTDLSLWRKASWKRYYHNRLARRSEVASLLADVVRGAGPRPAIIAGDFNAPPPDAIFREMAIHFQDSYHRAGTGWSNTFSNSLPVLRIDQVWTTPEFEAVGHGTYRSVSSDHRFVVVDLVLTR